MKQKRICAFLILVIMIFVSLPVCADGINVYINNKALSFDVSPQIISDRVMVPMRKIFESLGAVVTWDDDTKTATAKKGDTIVNISINSTTLFKNGVPKLLDVAPVIIDSRTLVPVRAVAESFDCTVDWSEQERSVYITSDNIEEKTILSAQEISERVSPSVFYIEVYDFNKKPIASGSGFFITSDGVAVTNYHVIKETASAKITTTTGGIFPVSNVIAYDENLDVAIIKVSKSDINGKTVDGFSSAVLADSDKIKAGQTVYALGSPVGLQNTISNGIISNTSQNVDGQNFIQITAAISHGSSGGALVNEYGEILGVTSAGIDSAQNIGFAIPINIIKTFNYNAGGMTYDEFAKSDAAFVLEVYPESVELNVGETKEIYVYAEGKTDDWSIYYSTNNSRIVNCKWGKWLEDNKSVCTLSITGAYAGEVKVTVYSDVDFIGKDIYVKVNNLAVQTYSGTNVPDYTAITGVPLIKHESFDDSECYTYEFKDISYVQAYVDYLLANGFKYYNEDFSKNIRNYYYLTPDRKIMLISLAYEFNQVWIYVSP